MLQEDWCEFGFFLVKLHHVNVQPDIIWLFQLENFLMVTSCASEDKGSGL